MTSKVTEFISNCKPASGLHHPHRPFQMDHHFPPILPTVFHLNMGQLSQSNMHIHLKFKQPPAQQTAQHKATRNNHKQSSSPLKPSYYSMHNQVRQEKLRSLVTLCSCMFCNHLIINNHFFPTHH
jgi:hypothetical protein